MHIELLASGYGLIEGPRIDQDNCLIFSDVTNGGVYRLDGNGEVTGIIPKRRGVGGIVLHEDGGLVVSGRNICHVKDGVSTILFDDEEIPGFNDMHVDSEGRIYFGSLRSNAFIPGKRIAGELWRLGLDGKAEQLYDDILLTNGIGFSPNGATIYHSDTGRNHIVAHDIGTTVGNRRTFATLERGAPDGLAVDSEGCIWVAAYGGGCVSRFSPAGELIEHLQVPATAVTSLCMGGPDGRDLYIVTADNQDQDLLGSIFRARMDAPGVPTPMAKVQVSQTPVSYR